MKHIFYFLFILFFVYEVIWLASAREHIKRTLSAKKWLKENRTKNHDLKDWPSDVKISCFLAVFVSIPVMILKLVGLFSFQWPIFLAWISVSLMTIIIQQIIQNSKVGLFLLHVAVTIVNMAFILLIVLNNYHFQMSVGRVFKIFAH